MKELDILVLRLSSMLSFWNSQALGNLLLPPHIQGYSIQHSLNWAGGYCFYLDDGLFFRYFVSLRNSILGIVVSDAQMEQTTVRRLIQLRAPLEDLLAHCYTSTPMFQAFTISDVITDVLILAIPIYWTSKLQMSRGRKVAVCAVFLLGGV